MITISEMASVADGEPNRRGALAMTRIGYIGLGDVDGDDAALRTTRRKGKRDAAGPAPDLQNIAIRRQTRKCDERLGQQPGPAPEESLIGRTVACVIGGARWHSNFVHGRPFVALITRHLVARLRTMNL
jgi:hypothetical protein